MRRSASTITNQLDAIGPVAFENIFALHAKHLVTMLRPVPLKPADPQTPNDYQLLQYLLCQSIPRLHYQLLYLLLLFLHLLLQAPLPLVGSRWLLLHILRSMTFESTIDLYRLLLLRLHCRVSLYLRHLCLYRSTPV